MKNQSEVKEILAQSMECTKAQAEKFIENYSELLKNDLFETGKVKIPGLGILEVRYRSEREGRNPQTKETITIPETLSIGFSVSSVAKTEVNERCNIEDYKKNK